MCVLDIKIDSCTFYLSIFITIIIHTFRIILILVSEMTSTLKICCCKELPLMLLQRLSLLVVPPLFKIPLMSLFFIQTEHIFKQAKLMFFPHRALPPVQTNNR